MPSLVSAADAPVAAEQFVSTELGIGGVNAVGGLNTTGSACTVHIQAGALAGDVSFIPISGHRYYAAGFNLGNSSGLSLTVEGRHVQAVYDANCANCSSWEMHVRYGNVTATAGPATSSVLKVDLPGDPTVPGGYVYLDRTADGAIRNANANVIPPGNFAAS